MSASDSFRILILIQEAGLAARRSHPQALLIQAQLGRQ